MQTTEDYAFIQFPEERYIKVNDTIKYMLDEYNCASTDEYINALREIIQELALLGLWRSKFFEHAAFYGGTALRVLYGLDRYSEDLDFSLLVPNPDFSLEKYGNALKKEIGSFGMQVDFTKKIKTSASNIDSAFIKANTLQQLITVDADSAMIGNIHKKKLLKVKLEVDINPPAGFRTENSYIFKPIPYSVRVYTKPNLFAGKMHAILCRKWKNRQKGRDWYDFVWYVGHYPQLNVRHLEYRMRQSGHYHETAPLTFDKLIDAANIAVDTLDIEQIKEDVSPFVNDHKQLDIWTKEFFRQAVNKIKPVFE